METLKDDLAARYSEVYDLAFKLTKGNDLDAQDLTQEIYIILLEYDQTKLKSIVDNGHLMFWLTRVMLNQYCSTTSLFQRKHHPKLLDENAIIGNLEAVVDDSQEIKELRLANIAEALSKHHFYDQIIFTTYYNGKCTVRGLAEAMNISSTSIFNTIKSVRSNIKDEVKNKH